ncbi:MULTISPECIES: DNA adenine methylase [Fusobacterium]|uniref:DNA adenine methylase n=1 Tax=Fusobacterium TaxID=848 RepID=UPI00044CFA97|nr:Dam family site-specific DNA-(adenine-N6)-methyltransferase [Fusobacterium sp. CM1]EUB30088.1 DNA adenine methylase [Fusobacterium sp. CM1]
MINSKSKYRRSPLFYVGDKYKIISQIKKVFPKKIDRFIEPFCGGGTVFLNTEANFYLINDIDSYVIKLHKFLISNAKNINEFWGKVENSIKKYELSASYLGKNVPLDLRKQFIKTYYAKYNKESYIKMRGDFNKNKNNMLLLYLLVIYGFNRMLRFNSYGDFNSPVGNVDFNKNVYEALELYFEYVLKKDIKPYSMDYEKFIKKVTPTSNDFVYLDPPYLITNSEYNKLWNEESEIRMIELLDQLNKKGIKFAVSNVLYHRKKSNGMFNEWAKKYNIIEIESNYINYHDNTKKDSLEVLVKNY